MKFHKNFIAYFLVACVLVGCLVLVYMGYSKRDNPNLEYYASFEDYFDIEYSNDQISWIKFNKYNLLDLVSDKQLFFRASCLKDLSSGYSVLFRPSNMESHIWFNNEKIVDFVSNSKVFHGTGTDIFTFRSATGINKGDEFYFQLTPSYDHPIRSNYRDFFQDIRLIRGADFLHEIIDTSSFGIICGIIICSLGLFMLIFCFVFRNPIFNNSKRALTFSFFALSSGFYVMVDACYDFLPVWIVNPIFCNIIDVIPVYLLILSFSFYFLHNQANNIFRYLTIGFICIMSIAILGAMGLQFTGTLDLYISLDYITFIAIIGGLMAIILLVYDYIKHQRKDSALLLLTFSPLFMALPLERINDILKIVPYRHIIPFCILTTLGLQFANVLIFSRELDLDNRKKISLESEIFQLKMSSMLSQIQPHFLYNALNTIHYLCRTNPQKAADTVESFSDYLRGNMDSLSTNYPISFKKELEHLENYLSIERLRFPYITIVYDISYDNFALPALTIQPLVENAIRYGVTQRSDNNGLITISSWKDDYNCYVSIIDNGVGFNPLEVQYDGRSHIGISNTKKRLEAMCNGSIVIESTKGIGTCINICIPILEVDNEGNSY